MTTRASLRRRLDLIRKAIAPHHQRVRLTDPITGVEPGPIVRSVNEGGVVVWSSAHVSELLKDAKALEKTSPWTTDARHKTQAELTNEEAKRLVEAAFKPKA
jgi:hypothetical protein